MGAPASNLAGLAAGVHVVTATYSGNDTYAEGVGELTSGPQVDPANLTVRALNSSRPFGAANVLNNSITGFVNGDTAATAVTGQPALSTNATVASHPGQYPITAALGGLSAANYTFSFGNGTLTVTRPISPSRLPR